MNKTRTFLALTIILSLLTATYCNKPVPDPDPDPIVNPDPEPEPDPDPEPEPEPERPKAPEWVDGYPAGVTVTEFTDTYKDGKQCLGFIATVDFSVNPYLKFNCVVGNKKQKPSEMFANFSSRKGTPALAINAGYFGGTTSMSLVYSGGSCQRMAPRSINWPNDENYQATVYPVRSAIGQMEDGHFEIKWAYCTSVSTRDHYSFPSALDNNEKTQTFMTDAPGPDWPGAELWEPVEAVGGGPRLVKNGRNVAVENYWAECLDSGGTSGLIRCNRTAIGYTDEGVLVIIVCDGRGSRGSAGCTLSELADKFISLGCTQAMNLDGGGSSAIIGTDGALLNAPSDAGGERAVVSGIVISEYVPRS